MKIATAVFVAALVLLSSGSKMPGQTLTTLATFNGANGFDPQGGLVMDAAGNLYGTTFNGGQFGAGTVFEVDAATHSLTTLFSFNGSNGGEPDATMTLGADGNLYGTTRIGGTSSSGTVFSFAPSTRTLTTLWSFDGASGGGFPLAPVVLDSNGNLYGTTSSGGGPGWGTVFEVNIAAQALTTLFAFSFGGADGQVPHTGLTYGQDGNYYGTTSNTLFRLSPSTHVLTTLATFDATTGGPPSNLLIDTLGDIYGTAEFGGFQNNGTVFKFSPSTQMLTTLATFHGDDGSEPSSNSVLIANGNTKLLGTTLTGGPTNGGTIFQFDLTTNSITKLVSFNDGFDNGPVAGLVTDGLGNFYGTTTGGGEFGHGTVFELSLPEPGSQIVLLIAGLLILMLRRRGLTNNK